MGHVSAGTTLKVGDGASPTEAFTAIAELTDISISTSQGTIDVTHLGSTNREYLAAIADGGEVSLSGNWIPDNAGHDTFFDDSQDGTERNYQIVWNDTSGTTYSFAAKVTSFDASVSTDDKMSFSGSLKIDGTITVS